MPLAAVGRIAEVKIPGVADGDRVVLDLAIGDRPGRTTRQVARRQPEAGVGVDLPPVVVGTFGKVRVTVPLVVPVGTATLACSPESNTPFVL